MEKHWFYFESNKTLAFRMKKWVLKCLKLTAIVLLWDTILLPQTLLMVKLLKVKLYPLANARIEIQKSMVVSDNTVAEENIGDFFNHPWVKLPKTAKTDKRMAINLLKSPGLVFEIGTNIGSASSSENLNVNLSTKPDSTIFCHTVDSVHRQTHVYIF